MMFRSAKRGLLIALLTLFPAMAAPAAAQAPLEPGTRIRIRPAFSADNVVGTLLFLDSDSLIIGAQPLATPVSIASLAWIDVSVGKRRHAARGAFIGAVTGAVAVLLYNAAAQSSCAERCSEKNKSAPLFGLGGAVVGFTLGYFIRTDRWSRMHLAPRLPLKRNPPDRADFRGS